jgi:hypothetical protein
MYSPALDAGALLNVFFQASLSQNEQEARIAAMQEKMCTNARQY